MAERTNRIKDSIEQAEQEKADAKAMLARYEANLKTARTEADSIIRRARELAQEEYKKIIEEGRIAAERELVIMRKQLEMERQASIASFKDNAAALVVAATSRLLQRDIAGEDNIQYAEMLLDEMLPAEARD